MNKEAIEVRDRLVRVFAKAPRTRKLLDIVLRNEKVQELIREQTQGHLGNSKEEGWDLLREIVGDRLELVKEGAMAGAPEEGRYVPRKGEPVLGAQGPGERTIRDMMFYVDLYQDTFVGPKSKPMLNAMSAYFRWQADQHPGVAQFRSRALEGNILSTGAARRLVGSYAARFFSLEWFTAWGIPVVVHSSRIVDGYDWGSRWKDLDHRVTVYVDPPGITERVRYAHPDTLVQDEDGLLLSTRCVLLKESGAVVPPYNVKRPEHPEDAKPTEDLVEVGRSAGIPEIGFEGGPVYMGPLTLASSVQTPWRPASVWPGSLIDDLYVLATELAGSYPWVERDDAAEFVLTGLAPQTGSLSASLYWDGDSSSGGRRKIVLDVPAWVPAGDVLQAYRRMQQGVVGGRNSLPGSKTCEVACFVWEHDRLNGYERLPWTTLCQRWNAKEPDSKFDEWRSFRACFERGRAAVEDLNLDYCADEEV